MALNNDGWIPFPKTHQLTPEEAGSTTIVVCHGYTNLKRSVKVLDVFLWNPEGKNGPDWYGPNNYPINFRYVACYQPINEPDESLLMEG